jgi:hypothetical protein
VSPVDASLLMDVCGGAGAPNITEVRTKDGQGLRQERTDFAYCQDKIERNCKDHNTGWFGTDKQAAAKCTLDTLPKACPPSLSQPAKD